ncbi:MAG: hypothetical protein ACKO2K_13950, partial [Alphaproteobacteria bacterium]
MSVSLRRAACGPRSVARSIGVALLVALLLAATSLAAHWHSEGVQADGCSVCVATHLTPLETSSSPGLSPQRVAAARPAETAAGTLAH